MITGKPFVPNTNLNNTCHGSSHPSCDGIPYHNTGWQECRDAHERAYRQQYDACTANPQCKQTREDTHDTAIIGFGICIVLLIAMLAYALQDL